MAVLIMYKEKGWSAGSSLGYFVINTTADFIDDPTLKARLLEIDEANLGFLSIEQLGEDGELVRKTILEKTIPKIKSEGYFSTHADAHRMLDELHANLSA